MPARDGGDGSSAGLDLDSVADDLYATDPGEFIRQRERYAAAARAAGQPDVARETHRMRRPTLAAWASNLLVRSRPQETRQFLELGRALREAHRTLDRAQMKELSAEQWKIVTALSRQAAHLADEAGHRLSDAARREVESTLRAVLADGGAAARWATGRLDTALTPPSTFPAAAAAAPARRAAPPPSARDRTTDQLAERRRQRQERLTRARQDARSADRRLRDRREERAAAEQRLRQARDLRNRAQERVAAAQQELQQARDELRRATESEQEAGVRHREVGDAVTRAEREAHAATREVEHLTR